MLKRVVITGSLAFDHIMSMPGKFEEHILPDKIHILNIGFIMDRFNKEYGGTAVNVAYTLSLLERKSLVVASAGSDFGFYKNHLKKQKFIDISGIKIFKKCTCSQGFVITDAKDNQIWGYYNGAMKHNQKLKLEIFLKEGDFLVIGPNEGKAMINFAKIAKKLRIDYMFDPAFNIPHLSVKDLSLIVENSLILIGNDYEIELVKRKLSWTHNKLVNTIKVLVTTLGSKGSIIESGSKRLHIPAAKPENQSDPTGAGDAYRAGFLAGYVRNFPLEICGKMGSVAAVYTVEKYGTQTHRFTPSQFRQRYVKNFDDDLPDLVRLDG